VIADSELCDVKTDCSYDPRNLVTKYSRHWNNIVSGEQKVGMTQARGLHIDENFAPNRGGNVHVLEVEPATKCVNYKCLQLRLLAVVLEPIRVSPP
jgi:hypothetical protein